MNNEDAEKESEQPNRKEAEKLQTPFDELASACPVGIYITDTEGHCQYVNPHWCQMAGLTPQEAAGTGWVRALHPEDRERVFSEWYQAEKTRNQWAQEYRFRTKEGKVTWIYGTAKKILDNEGRVTSYVGVNTDITDRKQAEEALQRIEWLLTGKGVSDTDMKTGSYGKLSDHNTCREILDAVGEPMLTEIAGGFLRLLGTSVAIYEANGDYALGLFASGWCRSLDNASRKLCETEDDRKALKSGKWFCHESCWHDASKASMEQGGAVDVACRGGIHLYATPIRAGDEIVGSINFGYGDPPTDPKIISKISKSFKIPEIDLKKYAEQYESRPQFIIETAKERLLTAASLIGEIVNRSRVEAALQENEIKYRALFEQAPYSICLINGKTGRIEEFNDRAYETLGYTRDEFKNIQLADIDCMESPEDVVAHVEKIMEQGGDTFETKHRAKDGEILDVLVTCRVASLKDGKFIVSIISDITGRKQAEEELRESRQKFHSMVENIGIGVTLISPKLEILEMNRQMRQWFPNINTDKCPICYEAFHTPPKEKACDHCPTIKTLKDGKVHESTSSNPHPDGDRNFRTISSPIINQQGEIIAAIEMVEDVTERMSLEAQLRQAQKLESIGTLAGGIAHDFNNILYAILGNTELVLGKSPPDSEAVSRLKEVLVAGERAKGLINQILSFSRQSQTDRAPIRCVAVFKEAIKLLQSTLPSSIDIKTAINCDFDTIVSNPTEIHQILMNLCTNAAQSLEKDMGEIEIRVENIEINENTGIPDPNMEKGSYVLLSVKDTGCGVHKSVQERIFDPFFTTKSPGAGTGLGLSVVHGIIRELGGAVTLESEPDMGSVFTVFIPCVQLPKTPDKKITEPTPSGSGIILIVDDEAALVKMQARMLNSLGYQVVSRTNSYDALETFRETPHIYDLVITDQTMPRMTGDKLAEELLQIRPDLPIILCTGYSAQLTEDRMKKLGIRKLLMKPVRKHTLAECISNILTGYAEEES